MRLKPVIADGRHDKHVVVMHCFLHVEMLEFSSDAEQALGILKSFLQEIKLLLGYCLIKAKVKNCFAPFRKFERNVALKQYLHVFDGNDLVSR